MTNESNNDGLICIRISKPDGAPISARCWENLIEDDSELNRVTSTQGINPMTREMVLVSFDVAAACWNKHPFGYTVSPFIFTYENGDIMASCVDQAFVEKGAEIAQNLAAVLEKSID